VVAFGLRLGCSKGVVICGWSEAVGREELRLIDKSLDIRDRAKSGQRIDDHSGYVCRSKLRIDLNLDIGRKSTRGFLQIENMHRPRHLRLIQWLLDRPIRWLVSCEMRMEDVEDAELLQALLSQSLGASLGRNPTSKRGKQLQRCPVDARQ